MVILLVICQVQLFELSTNDNNNVITLISNFTINGGEWHHRAAIFSNSDGEAKIYIDNVLDVSITFNSTYNLTNERIPTIGINDVTLTTNKFEGLIDGLRIYSKEMSQRDVKCLYNASSPTIMPTDIPSIEPSNLPTNNPTTPTISPTNLPSPIPTSTSTNNPTSPTKLPSMLPSNLLTEPTISPTGYPTISPNDYQQLF